MSPGPVPPGEVSVARGPLPDRPPARSVLGVAVHAATMDQALEWCLACADAKARAVVGVVNAAKVVKLRSDAVLRDAVGECDLVLADGQAVVWASRLLREPLPARVAGIDLFTDLLAHADTRGDSVFFLGARRDVLDRMLAEVAHRWPGVRVAGARDGYFADGDAPAVAAEIRAADPDFLFVGMTTPRKELFLRDYGSSCARGVAHGVGGSFDILAGITKRAPLAWRRLGLEWLYRVVQEPRRMWKRYLTTNTRFALMLAAEMARRALPGRRRAVR